MYVWANSLDAKKAVIIRHLRWWGWLLVLAFATGLSAAFYWEIPAFVEAIAGPDMYPYVGVTTPHMLDAVASACNLTGMLLMVLRCWEQWLWWLALDLIQIGEWGWMDHHDALLGRPLPRWRPLLCATAAMM